MASILNCVAGGELGSSARSEEEGLGWEQMRDNGSVDRWLDIVTDISDTSRLKAQSLAWQDALYGLVCIFMILMNDAHPDSRRIVAAVKIRFPPAIAAFEHPLPFILEHVDLRINLVQMLGSFAEMADTDLALLSSLKRHAIPSIALITWLTLADLPFDPEDLILATKGCMRILHIETDASRVRGIAVQAVKKSGPKAAAKQLNAYFRSREVTGMVFANVLLVAMFLAQLDEVVQQLFEDKTLIIVVRTIWKSLTANSIQSEPGSTIFWTGLIFMVQSLWVPGNLANPKAIAITADMVRTCDLFSLCTLGLYFNLKSPSSTGASSKSELAQLHQFIQGVIRACQTQPDLITTHIQPYLLPFLDHIRDLDGPHLGDHRQSIVSMWSEIVKIACGSSEATLRSQTRRAEIEQRKINTGGLVGCSWYQCIFHSGEAEGAMTIAILLDDHCRRAQYCSLYCQKRDWHDGNHKSVCRAA